MEKKNIKVHLAAAVDLQATSHDLHQQMDSCQRTVQKATFFRRFKEILVILS